MFISRRSTTLQSQKYARGLRRTSLLLSGSSCIEEVTYGPFGRYAVEKPTRREEEAIAPEVGERGETADSAATVVAAPPPIHHLNLLRMSDAEYRREVRIAGAPAAAEVAVVRNHGGHSKPWALRHKYMAECRFGPAGCRYWEIHARGIQWDCASI